MLHLLLELRNELKKIFNNIENGDYYSMRDIALFECFYGSGIRPVELYNLKDDDINFELEQITVSKNYHLNKVVRTIPLPAGTVYILKRYLQYKKMSWPISTRVFVNKRGKPISRKAVYQAISNFLKYTKAEKKGAFTLRHTYAQLLINSGVDILDIRALLGHRSAAATLAYNFTPYHLKKIHNESHPRA